MNFRFPRQVAIAVALTILLIPAGALGQANAGLAINDVDTSDYPSVSLIASIPQEQLRAGVPAAEVRENGRVLEAVVDLEASEGLEIVLLLDVSGSMKGEPLVAAQQASKDFIAVMPDSVDIAVIAFGSGASLAAEFSNDKEYLSDSIETLSARGETALYDGLLAAVDLLSASDESLKTIVMVSDGGDTVSEADLETAAAAMNRIDASLYSIELQSPENDREALDTLAIATGGSVYSAEESDLGAVFESISAQLLTRFRITYVSEAEGESKIVLGLQTRDGTSSIERTVTLPTLSVEANPDVEVITQAEPLPTPTLREGELVTVSWWDSEQALWLGIGALFLAIAGTLTIISLPRPIDNVLRANPKRLAEHRPSALTSLASSATSLAETTLTRSDRLSPLNAALERAGLAMRPAEFAVLLVSATLASAAVGLVLAGPAVALAFGFVVLLLARLRLTSMADSRSRAFGEQLSDSLQLMASSMRAGYGLLQAVDSVAAEAPAPASEEFQRIKVETQLGREVEDSMKAAANRVQSEDFHWVAESIEIHRQIGGDLAEILDSVNETIRDRNRIRRHIRALSAEGRISGIILSLIPIVLVFALFLINRDYLAELTQTTVGVIAMVLGLVAWLIGVVWIRRLVRLVF